MSMTVEEVAVDCMSHVDRAEAAGWHCTNYYRHIDKGLGSVTSTMTKPGVDHLIECHYERDTADPTRFVWSGYRLSTWAWSLPDADGLPFGFTYRIGSRTRLEDLLIDDIELRLPTLHIKKKSEA